MKEKPARIKVHVHPGAKRNEIVRFEDGVWHLKIAAPPTEGKAIDRRTARFTGRYKVGEVTLSYQMEVSLMDDLPAARLLPSWSVDKDLTGYEVCLACHDTGHGGWRCTIYPWAGNATALSRERLSYCGVPSAILFRPDLSLVTLFGITMQTQGVSKKISVRFDEYEPQQAAVA